jgi:PTH1 family peptidyl-tRNA hydrolase
MKVIVGLGNPGKEFENSRHNIGFIVADSFAKKRKLKFNKDGNSLVAKRKTFMLLKPLTYMNLCGNSIKRFYDLIFETMIICDDIYLPFGEVRLRNSGGDGGHNGLKSVIETLGDDSFIRLRIGVGAPNNSSELKSYVLENFQDNEVSLLEYTTKFVNNLIDCFIADGYQSMLNFFSKNKKTYSENINSESKSIGGI